uniref:Uncharacterized protein n=1 Tax=Panagrolaimus sp. JU765 TaxID=591449 RepID=A0AC34R299_9BILA
MSVIRELEAAYIKDGKQHIFEAMKPAEAVLISGIDFYQWLDGRKQYQALLVALKHGGPLFPTITAVYEKYASKLVVDFMYESHMSRGAVSSATLNEILQELKKATTHGIWTTLSTYRGRKRIFDAKCARIVRQKKAGEGPLKAPKRKFQSDPDIGVDIKDIAASISSVDEQNLMQTIERTA